jgi:membrane protease subunit (stomatin/prohibitin family)
MAIIDRIKCDIDDEKSLVWKFPSEELRLGSKLIVNHSQVACFVKGGEILDVFTGGTYTLNTANLPLLGKIIRFPYGGKTPFTAEVWFITKCEKRNLRWGTSTPIQVMDKKLNFLINIRAFGKWGVRINEAQTFLNKIVGVLSEFNNDKVIDYFIGEINQNIRVYLTNYFLSETTTFSHIGSNLNELSIAIIESCSNEFQKYGIELINFNIESINIPPDEEKVIQNVQAKKMEMDLLSNQNLSQGYITSKTFETIQKSAENPSGQGSISEGLGLGIGLAAGANIAKSLSDSLNPINKKETSTEEHDELYYKLNKLKKLYESGLINEKEYNEKKVSLLNQL